MIATPEQYAQMLDRAKAGAFAYPSVNVSSTQTLNAMKEGISKSLETLSEIGDRVGEEALTVLDRGDFFGEMALIDDMPRSADAKAHEMDTTVLSVDRSTLASICPNSSPLPGITATV